MMLTLVEYVSIVQKGHIKQFLVQDGFLYNGAKLCVPQGSLREAIIREAHGGGLVGWLVILVGTKL